MLHELCSCPDFECGGGVWGWLEMTKLQCICAEMESGKLALPFQAETKAKRGKPYDKANLLRAYEATKTGISVYRSARMYNVPESTLRDRTIGIVALDGHSGPERIFSQEEEKKLVDHIIYMGNIGYGYTKGNIQFMAADYARSIGKTVKAANGLSDHWFYAFLKRWPDLKMVKPQKLSIARAKCASQETIDNYFKELGTVLKENDLMDAPQRNFDETGISTEHAPPKIVCAKSTDPQSITSPKSSSATIIAGANAIGNHIPPFYVFPGKRWIDGLLDGAAAGSDGTMSDSGWSNGTIFETYVMDHLAKHADIKEDSQPTLIMYDGHKSHLRLTLTEWARQRHVVLFVLPPHTSHLTQPLDVSVFGPLKNHYYRECQTYLHQNPGITITRYEVAALTTRPYLKALCPENIQAGFRKSGIYPYNTQVFSASQLAPAVIYHADEEGPSNEGTSSNDPSAIEIQNEPPVVPTPPTDTTVPQLTMPSQTENANRATTIDEFLVPKNHKGGTETKKEIRVPIHSYE